MSSGEFTILDIACRSTQDEHYPAVYELLKQVAPIQAPSFEMNIGSHDTVGAFDTTGELIGACLVNPNPRELPETTALLSYLLVEHELRRQKIATRLLGVTEYAMLQAGKTRMVSAVLRGSRAFYEQAGYRSSADGMAKTLV